MQESSCPDGMFPCLADGALDVVIDGHEELKAPGTIILGRDVMVSAANLPGACRSFGFEKYWERKKLEASSAHGRRLDDDLSMAEWILSVSSLFLGACSGARIMDLLKRYRTSFFDISCRKLIFCFAFQLFSLSSTGSHHD